MSHPVISVGIAITPTTVTLNEPCFLTVSATLSSAYPSPITIYTWPTVFNLGLALRRKNFFCVDLSDNSTPIRLETTKGGKRSGHISRKLGSGHDQYFHTLEPGQTVDFTGPFMLPSRQRETLVAGHRYRFGVNQGERVDRWLLGTRAEVLSAPWEDEPPREWRNENVELVVRDPIEFDVLESGDPDIPTAENTSPLA